MGGFGNDSIEDGAFGTIEGTGLPLKGAKSHRIDGVSPWRRQKNVIGLKKRVALERVGS